MKPVAKLILISAAILLIKPTKADKTDYSSTEEFLKMILSNITAYFQYELPKNNSALLKVDDSKSIYDYGSFDFIIVGGGTAGAVLASRLSEIRTWKILLLEAGGTENDFSNVQRLQHYLWKSDMDWGYTTMNEETPAGNLSFTYPRGKVLGGSTVVNGAFYVRGNREDYDNWELEGWSFDEILPYFKKSENVNFEGYDLEYHNKGGYLNVEHESDIPELEPILNAFKELGQKQISDLNGREQLGISKPQYNHFDSEKVTSAGAFLNPTVRARTQLNITLHAFVTKLLFESNNRVSGVEFIKNGQRYYATTRKEVILSAGSVNSPQILMLSGIGPKDDLTKLGIAVLKNLPVGKRAIDHPIFREVYFRTNHVFFNLTFRDQVELYLQKKRPLTAYMSFFSFLKLDESESKRPDVEFLMDASAPYFEHYLGKTDTYSSYFDQFTDVSVLIALLHPVSRSSVTLKSNDPLDFPLINLNYYGDSEGKDMETMYQAMLYLEKLNQTNAFKKNGISVYYRQVPPCDSLYHKYTKKWYKCVISVQRFTGLHLVSTTPMGTSECKSVVTPYLKVHGFQNLRIVDAGVMPDIISGHTASPTIMIAEKASDIIKKDYTQKLDL